MKVRIEHDVMIKSHPRATGGTWLLILFSDRGEQKMRLDPARFAAHLKEVERAVDKLLEVRKNHIGQFIMLRADDPDLAAEEARDLAEFFQSYLGFDSMVVESRFQPSPALFPVL